MAGGAINHADGNDEYAAYIDEIQSLFEQNMEAGLRRTAQRMAAAR